MGCYGTERDAFLWSVLRKHEVQSSYVEMGRFWVGTKKKIINENGQAVTWGLWRLWDLPLKI